MANLVYIDELVVKLAQLMKGIATSTITLAGSDANNEFSRTRRHLMQMSRLLGAPPEFLTTVEDGWQFWTFISKRSDNYAARRDFVDTAFSAHYRRIVDAAETDFRNDLLQRDIEVLDQIGEGGFGLVYRAMHTTLNAARAVKVFEPSFYAGDPQTLRRFAREAELLSKMTHPGVVRFYDAGVAGRSPFLITELVEGLTLAEYVDQNGIFTLDDAKSVLIPVLEAVAYAHSQDVVHRDIKPSNIMKAPDRIVLLDFGAGGALAAGLSTSRLTSTTIGTPGYIAPELFTDPKLRDPRSDVYSLGVTAHFLLTGRVPNVGDVGYYLRQQSVPESMIGVIASSMMPLETRYPDAASFKTAIESA